MYNHIIEKLVNAGVAERLDTPVWMQLQQAREEIREDMNNGKSIKQQLKESTQLSAGILFKAVSSRLGKTVFDVHRENMIEKNEKEI